MNKLNINGIYIDDIINKYQNVNEYKENVAFYLNDENFYLLKDYIESQDLEMSLDATKGLYILALEFRLIKLYEILVELYAKLIIEDYSEINLILAEFDSEVYRLKEVFNVWCFSDWSRACWGWGISHR